MPSISRLSVFLPFLFIYFPCTTATANQIDIIDPLYGKRTIIYEQINDFAVVEGDILLAKIDDLERKSALFRLKTGGSRWKNGVVPFEIKEELPFINKLAVFQAIAHWQKRTHVEFIELTDKNRSFYNDYISFLPAVGTTCSSYVGRQGGKQEINLAPRCTTMHVMHEIGHALGLWHEQSRSDRDNFIRIIWENIAENHVANFTQQLTDGIDFGDYDYQSIMHYSAYAFSKNGKKTIIPLIDGMKIGQREKLSEKDIAAINAMYPAS
ncbi:Dot/Icm T4SS effector Zinc-dependent metalloprotease LegP [Legionella fairfieldensis]|uniref:Dot/Icm T4SS effector Zinc-dependent metalloprotease LegP n=1 Tax=Legionella fairfieldensis TaxID=45064 RepID=UPI000B0D0887|nr:Dot/Icm T4SS effector Zinc-dependent metalloprotease LegP [Legionella fairfieldensis]